MSGYDDALRAIAAYSEAGTTESFVKAVCLAEPYALEFGRDLLKTRRELRDAEKFHSELRAQLDAARRKKRAPIVWIQSGRYHYVAKVGRDVYHLEGDPNEFKLWMRRNGEEDKAFVANVGSRKAASRKIRALRRSKR